MRSPEGIGTFLFMDKEKLMKKAVELAEKGTGRVSPNPLVGAVIYKKGRLISQGYHHYFGGIHAEIDAIKKSKVSLKGSVMILNLEPCVHHGKTPPCAPEIVRAGIKKVIVGMKDPNPLVSGKGIRYLRAHNVEVVLGVCRRECRSLNRGFVSAFERKRPWVMLKEGVSLDGKIATRTGNSKWITNKKARAFGHGLRYASDMVLVGGRTQRHDKPSLLPYLLNKKRHPLGRPAKCIITHTGRIAACSEPVDNSRPFFIATDSKNRINLPAAMREAPEILRFKNLENLLQVILKKNYHTVLIEGGGELAGSFFDEDLIDEVFFIFAPVVLGGKDAVGAVSGRGKDLVKQAVVFKRWEILRADDNFIFHGLRV